MTVTPNMPFAEAVEVSIYTAGLIVMSRSCLCAGDIHTTVALASYHGSARFSLPLCLSLATGD